MKKIYILLFLLLFSFNILPQDQTLISGKLESGGYGAPVVKFTSIKDNFAVFVGGYGGWLINHTFLIGGGGYGLVNAIKLPGYVTFVGVPYERKIMFGYGGVILEFIGNPSNLIHYSISTLIGAGGLSYRYIDYRNYTDFYDNNDYPDKAVFVFEPAVNLELNITTFFRINVGGSYRMVRGSNNFIEFNNNDLSGFSANIAFKFGKF